MGFFALVHKLPPRWKDIRNKKNLSLGQIAAMPHDKKIAEATFTGTYRASISVFVDWAVANYQDQGFPTTLTLIKVTYRGTRMKGEHKQRAFTFDELRRMYMGPEMVRIAADPEQAARFWLCHIGLFTGARVNEICQLNPHTDILKNPSGIWYFWVTVETEAAEGVKKKIKTKKARQVPIHKTLLDLGILDYVEKVKATRAKLIFPTWKPQRGRASPSAERWFILHLKTLGLHGVENENGFAIHGSHVFRHSLLSYGKRPPFYLNLRCITGHAEKNDTTDNRFSENRVAEVYEDESITTPLSEKKQLLDRLDYGITFIKPTST
jgi:integrase